MTARGNWRKRREVWAFVVYSAEIDRDFHPAGFCAVALYRGRGFMSAIQAIDVGLWAYDNTMTFVFTSKLYSVVTFPWIC